MLNIKIIITKTFKLLKNRLLKNKGLIGNLSK